MAYVFDSSAVLAQLFQEPEYAKVEDLLDSGEEIFLPFMTLMEMQYRLIRRVGAQEAASARRSVAMWPAQTFESTPEWREQAARVKASGGLSMGDAWIAALALMHNATLVHKDKEFDRVAGLRSRHLGRASAK